jgi:TetR/AcrR family transcriptional regulator
MRALFVDAAESILVEQGQQGLSARAVAAKAGLKPPLLFYYFRTMDDLFRALVERVNDYRRDRFDAALREPEPMRALWRLMTDPSAAVLASELAAIANHRDAVRQAIVDSAREFRIAQTEAVASLLSDEDQAGASPAGIVMIAAALARTLVTESALGFTEGHADVLAIVEAMLTRFERHRRA